MYITQPLHDLKQSLQIFFLLGNSPTSKNILINLNLNANSKKCELLSFIGLNTNKCALNTNHLYRN